MYDSRTGLRQRPRHTHCLTRLHLPRPCPLSMSACRARSVNMLVHHVTQASPGLLFWTPKCLASNTCFSSRSAGACCPNTARCCFPPWTVWLAEPLAESPSPSVIGGPSWNPGPCSGLEWHQPCQLMARPPIDPKSGVVRPSEPPPLLIMGAQEEIPSVLHSPESQATDLR